MANARGKAIDSTHLSIDLAEKRYIRHRDYYGHMFRWAHVAKFMITGHTYKTARILDVGCGVDLPIAKTLYTNRMTPLDYVGVDYNRPEKFDMNFFKNASNFPLNVYGDVDGAKDIKLVFDEETTADPTHYVVGDEVHELPTIVTSFEVLEHIEPEHCRRMLLKIGDLMNYSKGSVAFLSTPCYDAHVGAADNHVSEITYEAFGALLEDLGFNILHHYGVFASQKDYKDKLTPAERGIFDKLNAYYDSNTVSNIFAPLYPQHSRNCLWHVEMAKPGYTRKFPPLKDVPGPWTSSDSWKDLDGREKA